MLIAKIVIAIAIVSVLVAEYDYQSSGSVDNTTSSGGTDSCGGCVDARKFWRSLPWWKKALYHNWWIYKKVQCEASGCSF